MKSLANKTTEELKQIKASLEGDRTTLAAQLQDLQAQLSKNYKALEMVSNEIATRQFGQAINNNQYNWADLLKIDSPDGTYKHRQQALRQLSPNFHITADGYYPETNQAAIKIRLDKTSEPLLKQYADLLNDILQHVIPLAQDPKLSGKCLSIMDPGLSEYYSYKLLVKDNGTIDMVDAYNRSRHNVHKTFNNMLEALTYLQTNYSFTADD